MVQPSGHLASMPLSSPEPPYTCPCPPPPTVKGQPSGICTPPFGVPKGYGENYTTRRTGSPMGSWPPASTALDVSWQGFHMAHPSLAPVPSSFPAIQSFSLNSPLLYLPRSSAQQLTLLLNGNKTEALASFSAFCMFSSVLFWCLLPQPSCLGGRGLPPVLWNPLPVAPWSPTSSVLQPLLCCRLSFLSGDKHSADPVLGKEPPINPLSHGTLVCFLPAPTRSSTLQCPDPCPNTLGLICCPLPSVVPFTVLLGYM